MKRAVVICGAWFLLGAALWFILPNEWVWIAYIPISLPPLAVIIAGVIILFQRCGYFKPRVAIIDGRTITQCSLCPWRTVQDNPISISFPIVKCGDAGGRTNYTPNVVPRWCPYAK